MGDSLGLASLLRDLVDVLIPGEGPWPSASMVGVQGVLAMRLLEAQGEAGADELERALLEYGGPLAPLDAEARAAVVRRLEAAEPGLFKLVRNATYLAYYENPAVVRPFRGWASPIRRCLVPRAIRCRRSISSRTGRGTGAGTTSGPRT